MTDHHNDHNQDDSQNHDDCEDCKKQRAQNEKFIQIYEKLQQVDQRASNMKSSVVSHKDYMQKGKETMKKIVQKVQNVQTNKNQEGQAQFQKMGFQLFAEILEKQMKNQLEKENQRLREIIKNMYQQRQKAKESTSSKSIEKEKYKIETFARSPSLQKSQQKTAAQWFGKDKITSRSESRKSNSFRQTQMGKSFEIFSTKSSFNQTKRKTFDKKDFEQLNLWLFEQRNQALEKQLYDKSAEQNKKQYNLQLSQLFKTHKAERYVQNAKNVARLDNSMAFGSRDLNKSKVVGRNTKKDYESFNDFYDTQTRKSYYIDNIISVMPQHQSSPSRYFIKRTKNASILPSISKK